MYMYIHVYGGTEFHVGVMAVYPCAWPLPWGGGGVPTDATCHSLGPGLFGKCLGHLPALLWHMVHEQVGNQVGAILLFQLFQYFLSGPTKPNWYLKIYKRFIPVYERLICGTWVLYLGSVGKRTVGTFPSLWMSLLPWGDGEGYSGKMVQRKQQGRWLIQTGGVESSRPPRFGYQFTPR